MQTLTQTQLNDPILTMISLLATLALYSAYSAYKSREINMKVAVAIMVLTGLAVLAIQVVDTDVEKERLINSFKSGDDVVCSLDNGSNNIVISKKRGYALNNSFFIKNDVAVNLWDCFLVE